MWCSNCQSSECPCLEKDYDEVEIYEDIDYEQDPQELEKATWIAENQQLNNNL
jgi:hypothetical protein